VWASGEIVTLRYRSVDGRFLAGGPMRVIEDTPERTVTFTPVGTIVSQPVLADGRELRDVPLHERWAHPRVAVRRPRHSTELIQLFPKGRAHSLWVVRDAEHSLLGWYVNLEEPHVVGAHTISSQDQVLDIWVPAETGKPEWKDEDELAAAVEVGRFTADEAAAIRTEGERVWAERPWPTGWEDWLPPVEWTQPELPDGWNDE
jgi:hypothetical protein